MFIGAVSSFGATYLKNVPLLYNDDACDVFASKDSFCLFF